MHGQSLVSINEVFQCGEFLLILQLGGLHVIMFLNVCCNTSSHCRIDTREFVITHYPSGLSTTQASSKQRRRYYLTWVLAMPCFPFQGCRQKAIQVDCNNAEREMHLSEESEPKILWEHALCFVFMHSSHPSQFSCSPPCPPSSHQAARLAALQRYW